MTYTILVILRNIMQKNQDMMVIGDFSRCTKISLDQEVYVWEPS